MNTSSLQRSLKLLINRGLVVWLKRVKKKLPPHLSSEEAAGTHVHGPLLAVKTLHVHLERSKHTALRQYFQVFIRTRTLAMQAS